MPKVSHSNRLSSLRRRPAPKRDSLLPAWRFDAVSKEDGQVRSLWFEAAFGSVFREAPCRFGWA
jgi:hypothetical protein